MAKKLKNSTHDDRGELIKDKLFEIVMDDDTPSTARVSAARTFLQFVVVDDPKEEAQKHLNNLLSALG